MAIPTITNNSPVNGSIAWGAFTIQYNGVGYQISAGSTSQRWVWWRYNAGSSVIEAGPDIPTNLTDDDLVLFGNKNGLAVRVQATSLIDGELLVDGSIFADALSANLINSTHIVTAGLDASVVKFGTMSGDRIAVNTLVGDRIIANSIGVGKLMVASMDNLFADPTFEITTLGSPYAWGTGAGVSIVTGAGPSGGNVLQIVNTAAVQQSISYPSGIPVEGGASFRFVGRLRQVGAAIPVNSVRFRIAYTTDVGTIVNAYVYCPAIPADTWTTFTGIITLPATAVSYDVFLRKEASNSTGTLQWDYVQMTRAANAELIVDGSVIAGKIAANAVTATEIAANAVTASEIAANAVTAVKIAADAVTASEIAADAVTADKIAANAVTAAKILADTITANEIAADTITANEIAADTITANEIAADTITADEVAAGTLTAAEIMAGTLTSAEIKTGSLSAESIAASAITSEHLKGKFIEGATLDILDSIHAEPGFLDISANLMEAESAIFHDNVTRRGTNNFIEGRETAASGVTNPGTPPTVTNVWPVKQTEITGANGSVKGFQFTGAAMEYAVVEDGLGMVLSIYDWTTGAFKRTVPTGSTGLKTVYSLAHEGDWFYILEKDFMGSSIVCRRYDARPGATEGTRDATYQFTVMDDASLLANPKAIALAVNSTDMFIVYINQSGRYRIRKQTIASKTNLTSASYTSLPTDLNPPNGNMAAIAGLDVNDFTWDVVKIQPYHSAQVIIDNFGGSWSTEDNSARALPYGGTIIASDGEETLDADGRVYTHSSVVDLGTKPYVYTWYDSDPTGLGTAESLPSPARNFAIANGAYVNIKTPLPPDDGSNDAPDTVRVYYDNFLQGSHYTSQELAAGRTLQNPSSSGNPAPLQSGFDSRPQTLPGGYKATKGDADGPIWYQYGDGTGRAGKHLKWDGNGEWLGEGAASTILVPTMTVAGHSVRIKEILPGVVICWGYLDVDDTNINRRDTGMVIPVGMRPAAQLIDASPQTGRTGWYRYFFGTDGMIEFEQSGGTNAPFEGFSVIWTTT